MKASPPRRPNEAAESNHALRFSPEDEASSFSVSEGVFLGRSSPISNGNGGGSHHLRRNPTVTDLPKGSTTTATATATATATTTPQGLRGHRGLSIRTIDSGFSDDTTRFFHDSFRSSDNDSEFTKDSNETIDTTTSFRRQQPRLSVLNRILDEVDGVMNGDGDDDADEDYCYDLDDDLDDDDFYTEVRIVPVKEDNYVNKRSLLSKGNKRRNELLLDNASELMDFLLLREDKDVCSSSKQDQQSTITIVNKGDLAAVLSDDEESLELDDIDGDSRCCHGNDYYTWELADY
eukprot:CAMPEP_0201217394 /NCGR_PEP_ID=MMETSP0851-20130426/190038_1 /ASSEMBLY_ACC=CAM_ASM_000631 /TAXON_ID=183588 /ORGANISM="Pseudo-nitzschia fraudulenta, Strain WWA7" /LENGTH=290 /DNA_ID=CAMNT_0047507043 /DNA_START=157 /DNA_END=1029 /DNA_ORIENTATION=-